MSQTQKSYGDWVKAEAIGVKVHAKTGAVIDLATGKAVPIFRDKVTGSIKAVLPKNTGQKGLGKGRMQQLGRIILAVLNEGAPFQPRFGFVAPLDGHKWNIVPANLEWIKRDKFMERRIMTGNAGIKLEGHSVLALKEVVGQLTKEGIKDYDAIGSAFSVSGLTTYKIINGRSWAFVGDYIKQVSSQLADYKIHKAKDAAAEFAEYDKELAKYMVSYETVE